MDKKKALPKFTSPIGVFKYPKISEPDYGTKEYPKENGEFSVKLVLEADSAEAKSLIAALTPHYEAALAEAQEKFAQLPIASRKKLGKVIANPLFNEVYDKETEEPTGQIEFSIKMKHKVEIKKGPKAGKTLIFWPTVFDAKGLRIPRDGMPAIWGGTTGRVSFEVYPYFVSSSGQGGLGLRMLAVQIVKPVFGGERTAESLGLGAVEDGYEYDPNDAAAPKSKPDTDGTTSDDNSGDF